MTWLISCLYPLQTYAIHHRGSNEVEVCTYVCDVLSDGAAYLAGMRPGNLIMPLKVSDVYKVTPISYIKGGRRSSIAVRA